MTENDQDDHALQYQAEREQYEQNAWRETVARLLQGSEKQAEEIPDKPF